MTETDKYSNLNENERKIMGLPEISPRDYNNSSQREREVESPREVTENIIKKINENKSAGSKNDISSLEARRLKLAKKPILDDKYFFHASYGLPPEGKFVWTQTDMIVGRPSAENYTDGWAHEYDSRTGRLVSIATELTKKEIDINDTENIFHAAQSQASERIKLTAADGPDGPIYLVEDGTHRVGASKLAELKEIPAEVRRSQYPMKIKIENLDEKTDWQKKIDYGIIQGRIETGKEGEFLIIDKELFSWARETNPNRFTHINRTYEKLYPKSLDNLTVPRDVLTDAIAFNYFMAGRYEAWLKISEDY